MSSKLSTHVANLGDIDVYRDNSYVQITVDGDTAIFVDHKNAEDLAFLIKAAVNGEKV
jgi:hypothetical protein